MATTPKKRWIVVALVLVVVLVIGVAVYDYGRGRALWGTSDSMAMLQKETLASRTILGLSLVSSTTEQRSDFLTPSGPTVTNCFSAGAAPAVTLSRVIDYAQSQGWAEAPDTRDETTWVGRKDAALGGKSTAIIRHADEADAACAPEEVEIRLTY